MDNWLGRYNGVFEIGHGMQEQEACKLLVLSHVGHMRATLVPLQLV